MPTVSMNNKLNKYWPLRVRIKPAPKASPADQCAEIASLAYSNLMQTTAAKYGFESGAVEDAARAGLAVWYKGSRAVADAMEAVFEAKRLYPDVFWDGSVDF